jgi:uncharacterized repeat protein (TIGR03806 family)
MKVLFIITGLVCFVAAQSFVVGRPVRNGLRCEGGPAPLPTRLSDYGIFQGSPVDLNPSPSFKTYELSTPLFTDYAEKQRLVKMPEGSRITVGSDGLPTFPDGTVLVKTFYYYTDKRVPSKGKRIVETRVMVRSNAVWTAGTYLWNAEQTEAILTTNGSVVAINWVDDRGAGRWIKYAVPSGKDCATCHTSNKTFQPIGFKDRNLQRKYLQLIDGGAERPKLPDWQDSSYTLAQRLGAYLDMNCAHCHNPAGFCAKANLDLSYEAGLPTLRTLSKMADYMRKKRMPLLGTTVVHEEGLALMETFIKTLK